jgi:flagellar hook-length control protein FliK
VDYPVFPEVCMNLGVMGMNASPFDMILGFGVQNIPGGPSGPGDFGKLMGLFPQLQGMSNTPMGMTDVLVPGLMNVPTESLTDEQVPMQMHLPEGLASLLGMEQEASPELVNVALTMAKAEQVVSAPAQIVVSTEGNEQQLFLKVVPKNSEMAVEMMPEAEMADEESMLIPMQIRTVERAGNRLIADAQLRTAAGKDVSVRLKLDVTGNLNGMISENSILGKEAGPAIATPQQHHNLVELLGNLGVKSLVIESVEAGSVVSTQQALPQATVKPLKSLTDIGMARFSGQADVSEKTDGMPTKVNPFAELANQDGTMRQETTFGQSAMDAMLTDGKKSGVEKQAHVEVSAVEFVTETGAVKSEQTTVETPKVRFYNLDQGLEQLKRNPGQKIQVQLSPASLGKMDLSIVNHRGTVTVNLTVDSMQARAAVERGLGQLENHLTSSGIKVDSFQIHVNESNRNEAFHNHQFNQQGFFGGKHQGQNFRRFNQEQLKQGFNMTNDSFDKVMVNCLA